MYFPYVFGQSSELLALRSASERYLSSGAIIPVIEPVKSDPSRLIRCLEELGSRGQCAIIVLNPFQGELSRGLSEAWVQAVNDVINKFPSLIPALLCLTSTQTAEVQSFIQYFSSRGIAILYRNPSFTNAQVKTFAAAENVVFHIVIQGKITANQLPLLPAHKLVHITDRFNKKPRNADYYGAEHFTDSHRTYVGVIAGFGDYTVIGSELQTGGGPPGAVAIHITYRNMANGDIWVQHFVSDEVDRDEGTPESKFLNAVGKLRAEHNARPADFGANSALDAYFGDQAISHFPGLAKNKERQILHHIARVHDLLTMGL